MSCIDTEEEEEDCQKEFLEKNLEKNLKTTTDDFLGERHFKNFFNDSHSTKYEHSHYKQTHTHSNRAFVTEVIVVVGFVFVVVVADIYAKTR